MTTNGDDADWRRRFAALVASREGWLIARILAYAKERDYTRYTSPLFEAWRVSIQGLSQPLIDVLMQGRDDLELGPDSVPEDDPCAAFGVLEARRHRTRGISLPLFLGLTKYYGESFLDLVEQFEASEAERRACRRLVRRFFDRVEIGFCSEWSGLTTADREHELEGANRSLTNEKNRLLTVLESLEQPVIFFERDGTIGLMNRAAAQAFAGLEAPGAAYYDYAGRSRSGPDGEGGVPSFTPPLIANPFDDAFHRRHTTGAAETHAEEVLQTVWGARWFDIRSRPMLNISEKFAGHVVILTDITRRRESEAALRTLKRAIEATHHGVVITETNSSGHQVVYANGGFETITGYSVAETLGHSGAFLYRNDCDQPGYRELVAAFDACRPTSVIARNYKKNGEMFWNHIQIAPVVDESGSVSHMVGIMSDISDRLRVDRLRTLGTIAAGVAHELNNPLMGIGAYVRYSLDRSAPGKVHDCLEKANRQLERMGAILKSMTSFVRPLHNGAGPVELAALVERVCDLLRSDFMVARIKVKVGLADTLPPVTADEDGLQQVLINILINACAAISERSGDDKWIKITATPSRRGVCVAVSDSGAGVPPELIERIFEPFFTTKGGAGGTGLGLAICQQIVGAVGGTLSYQRAPEGGACFLIDLCAWESPVATDVKGGRRADGRSAQAGYDVGDAAAAPS